MAQNGTAQRDATQSDQEPHSLQEVLDRIEATHENERTTLDDILDCVGHRSFGPILVVAGLVMLAPLVGDIPGVPVLMGTIVVLTAAQIVVHREHVWLPGWLLRRSVAQPKLDKALKWLRPVARFCDKIAVTRLTFVLCNGGRLGVALAAILVGLASPAMELVPFSANLGGVAITAFGLSLITCDGLMALIAFGFTIGVSVLLVMQLL